jgi:hypothetical protein
LEKDMPTILFVKIKTKMSPEALETRMKERLPRFRAVPGLVQKFYGRDAATGDACGIYLFKDEAALAAFRETELAKTIPAAYEAEEVRREVFEMLMPLHPERGPVFE